MPAVHPTNKALTPKRTWDLLPATDVWAVNHVLVTFDADPDAAPAAGAAAAAVAGAASQSAPASKRARLEGALIRTPAAQDRPLSIAEGTVRVDYLLPDGGGGAAAAASSADDAGGDAAAGGGLARRGSSSEAAAPVAPPRPGQLRTPS